ncbi:MAG: glycosyltransferase family 9 protein, partial [Candidatus Omnitrophota bacterium]|nr:glycosyltransferase family 9 protein [Candidatus Omnitrophota bacterium]
LFSTATIRNIRRNFPDSFIACIIPERCYPVLKGNPHLDEILIFNERGRQKSILAQLRFVKLLRSKGFDTAFLLHRSFSRALICRLAGIKQIIGYLTKKRGFLLSKKILPPQQDTLHRIDYYLTIIEKAGLRIEDRYPEFFVSEEDEEFINSFLKKNSIDEGDFLVVINPGGNWLPKRWPKQRWIELADRLTEELAAKIVISGAGHDRQLAAAIGDKMKRRPLIACGALNLKQLGALSKRADLFITGDTGPLHIATAAGAKKIIALFGPTSPEVTGPFPLKNASIISKDVGCKIPCYLVHCKDNRCMKAITVEDVIEKIRGANPC